MSERVKDGARIESEGHAPGSARLLAALSAAFLLWMTAILAAQDPTQHNQKNQTTTQKKAAAKKAALAMDEIEDLIRKLGYGHHPVRAHADKALEDDLLEHCRIETLIAITQACKDPDVERSHRAAALKEKGRPPIAAKILKNIPLTKNKEEKRAWLWLDEGKLPTHFLEKLNVTTPQKGYYPRTVSHYLGQVPHVPDLHPEYRRWRIATDGFFQSLAEHELEIAIVNNDMCTFTQEFPARVQALYEDMVKAERHWHENHKKYNPLHRLPGGIQ
ncbi:hypothetical protein HZA45_02760 [Candidatus Peregrinibacteria bacterium]|nr:hypothetical protein [Candidatus Peregrinibacteria bacterium]